MPSMIQSFNQYPRPVRAAFQTFVVAWCWHYFSLYMYFLKGEVPIEQIAIGVMLFVSLALFKKWGRILSMIFNFLAIIWYLWLSMHFYYAEKHQLIYIAAVNVTLFTVSTITLFNKKTGQFFKLKTEEKDKQKAKEIDKHTREMAKFKKKSKK